MDPAYRHVAACNNAVLPGGRTRLLLDSAAVGWLSPPTVATVVHHGGTATEAGIDLPAARLQDCARAMAAAGRFRWRDEAFDVRAEADGPALARVDRGALPGLGIRATGVHLNGLVRRADGWWLWVARRAADKLLDPGKLDHLVAGGVPAGLTPAEALVKEAEEEAGLPAELVAGAVHTGVVDYALDRPEGLRRDRLHCYDLVLPESFQPRPVDGEVAGFELWPLPAVLDRVRRTDDFKFNVPLVLLPLFERQGLL